MKLKRITLLVFWLMGILFPMAWLGKFSGKSRQIFNALFEAEWMHWLMHAALYAGLAVLLVMVFSLEIKTRTIFRVCALVLLVGVIQEGIQLISGVQVLSWNTFLDLCIDLSGASIGLGVIWGWRRWVSTKAQS